MSSRGRTPTALDAVLDDSSRMMRSRDKTLQSGDAACQIDLLSSASDTPQSAPWQRWVPESHDNGLCLEQQCLLGIGLMLQRAPAVMRTQSFARAVWQWCRAEQLPEASDTFKAAAGRVTTEASEQLPMKFSADIVDANNALTPSSQPDAVHHVGHIETPHARQMSPSANPVRVTQIANDTAFPAPAQADARMAQHPPSLTPDMTTPSISPTPDAVPVTEVQITTALGGVFYLINLGLFLQLYGTLQPPRTQGSPCRCGILSPCSASNCSGTLCTLTRCGRCWPIWLAARQEAPGKDFEPPDCLAHA